MEQKLNKKWYEKMPHIFVILFSLIVFAAILTWVVPAGRFERQPIEGTYAQGIIPGTYHGVEQNPAGVMDVFKSIIQGMNASSSIIFMILIASGSFAVITSTGALESGLGVMLNKINRAKTPPVFVIWAVTFLFSGFGIMVGPEIQIPFTIVSVAISLGLGYDLIVGLAMIMGGGYVGFAAAPVNPSTIGTAQIIGGLPYYSGIEIRWVFWFVSTGSPALSSLFMPEGLRKIQRKAWLSGLTRQDLASHRNLINIS